MDSGGKLSREAQVVIGGGVVLLVLSFFNWQQITLLGISAGANEWHGIGILAGLLVIAMLVWEVRRLTVASAQLGSLSPGLVSLGLALLVALFTLLAFVDKSLFRHWPAWIALLVAIVIAVAAVMRAGRDGVKLPA